jgi:hypothetical protein
MKKRDSLRCLLGIVALAYISAAQPQSSPRVSVTVRQLARGDGTVQYLYRVNNQSPQPVVALLLGHDYAHGVSELTSYPLGWQDSGATSSLASPTGWQAEVFTTEESRYVEIEWRSQGMADITPSQRVDGFGVILASPSSVFTSSAWTAILGDGTTVGGKLIFDAPR